MERKSENKFRWCRKAVAQFELELVRLRKSQPTNNPSSNPISGAKGTAVVRLTMTPSTSPIAAPMTRTSAVPLLPLLTGAPMPGHTSRTGFVLLTWSV